MIFHNFIQMAISGQEPVSYTHLAEYDRRITYPVGVHVYFEGQIHEVIRSVSGYRKPATVVYLSLIHI